MSLETIKERVEVARQHIDDLCTGKARWTMHVPVDMERDSDTIFAIALANTEALLRVAEAAALYRTAMAVALEYGDSNDPHGDRLWDAATSTGDALTRALDDLDALP